ncbi:MAG: YesL family protein [Hominimerdicola sp.]
MAFFGNYDTPGKGVLRTPHEKRGFFKFWEIYGRHMWKLIQVNLLYIVFCIPIITFGPATAALTKVVRNYSQERNVFILHDFVQAFKKNFKQGLVMGIIDIIFVLGFIVSLPYYNMLAKDNSIMYVPYAITLICMLMFYMMHFYIYLMICSTNLKLWQIIKNSFFLVSLGLKQSLWTLLATVLVLMTMYLFLPYTLVIIPFWPISFAVMVVCFNCYPIIRKHVIQPYYDQRGEQNPEFAEPDVETLFEDKAAEEKAPPKSAKSVKHKGKTIS